MEDSKLRTPQTTPVDDLALQLKASGGDMAETVLDNGGCGNPLVSAFLTQLGRPPRVLHLGNIANNAYLNAKILNKAGFECDVICHSYYHIMGCPEWDEADFTGDWGDDNSPDWQKAGVPRSFSRPKWFVSGSVQECVLRIVRMHGLEYRGRWWLNFFLTFCRKLSTLYFRCKSFGLKKARRGASILMVPFFLKCWMSKLVRVANCFERRVFEVIHGILFSGSGNGLRDNAAFFKRAAGISTYYASNMLSCVESMSFIFKYYDVVIGYATDGAYPLIAGKKPYCAFEHGTIRSLPFEDTDEGRMCKLTYQNADFCFITNCDNIVAAEKLGLKKFCFVPHPVNEDIMIEDKSKLLELRDALRRELDSDFIVFHPSRQHWDMTRHPSWEKGNDFLIKGLAKFIHEVNPKGAAIFVDWGQRVEESKALLSELGIASRVKWIRPQPNVQMIKYIKATDILADQFFLGAFGSTMPKGLLHGTPVLIHLDEERHKWCFPEMPPILNAQRPDDICAALKKTYEDADFRNALIRNGRLWYDKYHSNKVICDIFSAALQKTLEMESKTAES